MFDDDEIKNNLYFNSIKRQNEVEEENKEKDKLYKELNDLGYKPKAVDYLYGTKESLKNQIDKLKFRYNLGKSDMSQLQKGSVSENNYSDRIPFEDEIELHEELKNLARHSYYMDEKMPSGYEFLGQVRNDKNGFDAFVSKKNKDVVITYRGTNEHKDRVEDANLVVSKLSTQLKDAQDLYDLVKRSPKYKDARIIANGHSLGGTLAQYVASRNAIPATTFNPLGSAEIFKQQSKRLGRDVQLYPDNIVNYRRTNDSLVNWSYGNDLGKTFEVGTRQLKDGEKDVTHYVEYMGELKNRTPFVR